MRVSAAPALRRSALVLLALLPGLASPSSADDPDVLDTAGAGDGLTLASAVTRALQDGFVARIARLSTGQAEDVGFQGVDATRSARAGGPPSVSDPLC